MSKKTTKILVIYIIIITLTFLTCGLFNKPMELVLPTDLYDGDATLNIGEGTIQIYDYEETDTIIELKIIPADEDNVNNNNEDTDDLSKILIIPSFVTIPEDELTVTFNCQAVDTDMSPEDVKDVTIKASAVHYQDVETTVAIHDVEAEPTPEPTTTPTSAPQASPGAVWLEPSPTGTITNGNNFTTEVHCNTGTKRLASYAINFTYTPSVIIVNTSVGTDGVQDGSDKFSGATTVTNESGKLTISNTEAGGIDPGTDLHIITINWTAVGTGTISINITVDNFIDEDTATIGTPTGIPLSIIVEPSKKGHY